MNFKVWLSPLVGMLFAGLVACSAQSTSAPELGTSKAALSEEKVTICHFPPGNPDNAHTITVGASARRQSMASSRSLPNSAATTRALTPRE